MASYIVGKWYWFEDLECIARFSRYNKERFYFSEAYWTDGNSLRDDWFTVQKSTRRRPLATEETILACLKAYATRAGYVKGTKIKSLIVSRWFTIRSDKYSYKEYVDEFSIDNLLVYENGKWAEIIGLVIGGDSAVAPAVGYKFEPDLKKYYFVYLKMSLGDSYYKTDGAKDGQAIIDKHPLSYQDEINLAGDGWRYKVISWQEITKEEYETYKDKIA